MSTFSFTTDRQINLKAYAETIRRGASRTIAALLGRQLAKPVVSHQGAPLRQENVTADELKKLYRMIGGLDSVNQQVVRELDLISQRG